MNQLATTSQHDIMERVLMAGDLKALSPQDRTLYYAKVCDSVGLNPLTRPFEYITLNGKLTLYARRDCADQLRKINGVSIEKIEQNILDGIFIATAYAKDKHGKTDSDIGAVSIEGLKGEARSNAMMKAITKAKRRVTLSICGLGMLDETEVSPHESGEETFYDPSRDVKRHPGLVANANIAPADSKERDDLINRLEDATLMGMAGVEEEWKSFSKAERTLVGKEELDRIKKLAESLPEDVQK